MPIYEYRCPNGHEFEVVQRMSEDPISRCQECGAPVERMFHPVAVHFKGSGFYTTDYARGTGSDGKGAGKSDAKKDSSEAGSAGGKSDGNGSSAKKAKAESGGD